MRFIRRYLRQGRVRSARRELARSPSPKTFVQLAREHLHVNDMSQVVQVCEEGLQAYPGNQELQRMLDRAQELRREDRIRVLTLELRDTPRPGLWRELCATLLEAGRSDRAEEFAQQWLKATNDAEAKLMCAQARLMRFFTDRRREDGLTARDLLQEAEQMLPRDPRPLQLQFELASRVGAWKIARSFAARLLELLPGDPALEARFRTLMTLSDRAPSLEQALREVEKSGRLADEEQVAESEAPESGGVRPVLQELVASPGVESAVYIRGATALVQGPKGATAERAARAVRDIVQRTRSATRRMGLGRPFEIWLEGSFGTLLVAPGERSAGALLCSERPTARHEAALMKLAGIDPRETGDQT
jgi:hypothetical protein